MPTGKDSSQPQRFRIEENGLDLRLINPALGSKFSPNLYRWLTSERKRNSAWAMRVYRATDQILWIGILDQRELIGAKLMGVLCNGVKEQTYAWQGVDAVEVSDFWTRYTAHGRCAIDVDHGMSFINDDTRWSVSGNTRSCLWCGNATQTRKIWTEEVLRSAWVAAPTEPSSINIEH